MIRLISLMLVKTCVWLDKIWLANAKSKDVLYVLGWKFQPCPFWQPCFSNVEGCLGGWKAAFGRGFKLVMKGSFFGEWIDRYWMNLGGTLVMWYGGRVSITDDPGSFMSWFVDTISVAWHLWCLVALALVVITPIIPSASTALFSPPSHLWKYHHEPSVRQRHSLRTRSLNLQYSKRVLSRYQCQHPIVNPSRYQWSHWPYPICRWILIWLVFSTCLVFCRPFQKMKHLAGDLCTISGSLSLFSWLISDRELRSWGWETSHLGSRREQNPQNHWGDADLTFEISWTSLFC